MMNDVQVETLEYSSEAFGKQNNCPSSFVSFLYRLHATPFRIKNVQVGVKMISEIC